MENLAAVRNPAPYLTIRRHSGWPTLDLSELLQYRDLFWTFAVRDLKLRYRQTALGVTWIIAQPLMASGILSFVFGVVAGFGTGLDYIITVFVGQLGWQVFSGLVMKNSTTLVNNSQLLSKVYFPRLILPMAGAATTVVDFAVALALLPVLLIVVGVHSGGIAAIATPFWVAILGLFALGISLIAGSLMVRYRDVQFIVPVIVQCLMFISPVAYTTSKVPTKWLSLYSLNPLAAPIEGLRWSLLGTPPPEFRYIIWSIIAAAATFMSGVVVFKRLEHEFADVV